MIKEGKSDENEQKMQSILDEISSVVVVNKYKHIKLIGIGSSGGNVNLVQDLNDQNKKLFFLFIQFKSIIGRTTFLFPQKDML